MVNRTDNNRGGLLYRLPGLSRWIVVLGLACMATGCFRGQRSDKPPIHINPNMDWQPKFQPEEKNPFFADGSAMRLPVEGTVARGDLPDNIEYATGHHADGTLVAHSPVPVTMELLQRGEERYNIYCSPCHSRVGDGQGIIREYGYLPPGNYHEERLVKIEDGHIFDVITNGIRNMPSYRHQIPVSDRWAIVAYVRALQRSWRASADEVPESVRAGAQK